VPFRWTPTWLYWLNGNNGDECGQGDGQEGHKTWKYKDIVMHMYCKEKSGMKENAYTNVKNLGWNSWIPSQ